MRQNTKDEERRHGRDRPSSAWTAIWRPVTLPVAFGSFVVFSCGFLTIMAMEAFVRLNVSVLAMPNPLENLEALAIATLCGLCCVFAQHAAHRSARIAAEKRESELAVRARTDELTGLGSSFLFEEVLQGVSRSDRRFLALVNAKGFAEINNCFGHALGDGILREAGRRLKTAFPDALAICRLHSDRFAVISNACERDVQVKSQIETARVLLDQPFVTGLDVVQSFAIGVVAIDHDDVAAPELMRHADVALQDASSRPGSEISYYADDIVDGLKRRRTLEMHFRRALEKGEVKPFFQPIVDVGSRKILGFEALARWSDPALGVIAPSEFIPVAETCGLIGRLSEVLLEAASEVAKNWPSHLYLSFNVSATQLTDQSAALRVLSVLGRAGFSPTRLHIEITESAALERSTMAQMNLKAMRNAGIRVYMDDFGIGYCNFERLVCHEIDGLKIDKSLVIAINEKPELLALVSSAIGMGRDLGLAVIAEGVESEAHHETLIELRCGFAQGFHYGMPADAEETNRLIMLEAAGLRSEAASQVEISKLAKSA